MKLFHFFARLLFPPRCVACRKLLKKEETDLCHTCRVEGPYYVAGKRAPVFLDSFVAVWYYEGNIRNSLLRFKFHRARRYAPAYGRLLAMRIREAHPEGFDVLTWVPVSWQRKLSRGYDQSELLARAVARELGVMPVSTLQKVRHNRRQSGISEAAQRRANVLGAYRVRDPALILDRRILLVDDILTTGSTLSECARILLTEGAREVHSAAIAAARKR